MDSVVSIIYDVSVVLRSQNLNTNTFILQLKLFNSMYKFWVLVGDILKFLYQILIISLLFQRVFYR